MRRLNQIPHLRWWLWMGGVGLVFVSAAVLVLVNQNKPRADESPSVVEHEPSAIVLSLPQVVSEPLVHTVQEETPLPALDFPPGSVEEACGFNEFPTFWVVGEVSESNDYKHSIEVLESNEACRAALEAHINGINPYLWSKGVNHFPFVFVVLDEPLTFGRIFADPNGDLIRVQDALSNPECLLPEDETNWELEETCHADAVLNYALLNRFCFDEGYRNQNWTLYWPEDNPTPEQDRFMWKQSLERQWVRMQCETLSSTLELTSEQNPILYELVMSLDPSDPEPWSKGSSALLIELAARLGDNAAGLTYSSSYGEDGSQYGRFSWLLKSDQWWEFTSDKDPPSVDRFIQVFRMLALASARRPDPRDEFQFDWKMVAQHLCAQPYYYGDKKSTHEAYLQYLEQNPANEPAEIIAEELVAFREKYDNPKSCKEVVHEIRQREFTIAPVLTALDKFEQVALELDVYD